MRDYDLTLLGTMPDRKLAQLWNISREYVRQLRTRHNIPKYDKINYIPKECIGLLGKLPEQELAQMFNIPVSRVRKARLDRGIANYWDRPWTPENISLLGTMSDDDVAEHLKMNASTVRKKRQQLNIPPFKTYNRWTPTVNWDGEKEALLGTMSDKDLANLLGVNLHIVYARRAKLGIPAHRSNSTFKWDAEKDALLGTMTDQVLSEQLGCHVNTIRARRSRLGIPRFRKTK